MSFSSWIGSGGVCLLLIAFFLNLFRILSQDHRIYILLNIIGAALSCYASLLIRFIPFVVLEACWCLVACAALIKKTRFKTGNANPGFHSIFVDDPEKGQEKR